MAVVPVQKICIIAHQAYQKPIFDYLYDIGIMQMARWPGVVEKIVREIPEKELTELEYQRARIKFAIDFLEKHKEKEKISFIEKLIPAKIIVSSAEIEKIAKEFDYKKIVKICEDLESQLNLVNSKLTEFQEKKKLLAKWRNLNVKLTPIEAKKAKMIFGICDESRFPEFIRELEKKITEIDIRLVHSEEKICYLVIVFSKHLERDIEKIFFEYDFEKVELPQVGRTPQQELARLDLAISEANKEIGELYRKIQRLARDSLRNLKIVFDYITEQLDEKKIQKKMSRTKRTFSLVGWVKKADLKNLKNDLKKITKEVEIVELKPEPDEPVPVAVENRPLMRPFEAVTRIYGMPKSTEVDPTPFLAIFFILFFALCLTDAGYGLVLAGLTFFALKFLKIPRESQRLIRLLMYGGLVTVAIGALTGGWFGVTLEDLPDKMNFIKIPLLALKAFDPIKDPIKMLLLAFVLGYIQLLFGLVIDIWWKIKNKKIKEGIFDSGSWFYFLLAIAFWAMTTLGILPIYLKTISLYSVLAGIIFLVLTQGRHKKNIFMKLLTGIGSLYGIVGYVSDILSYSRLLALGLATAVIAMVVNLLAVMFRDMIPYLGWVVMVLILIGGHLFNMVINILGAFIHSSRLQFVEFFPKFFEGGGEKFKPFKREGKYVVVK